MNESDYEDAVVNFYERLYAFGYSLTGNRDDASELTQETFYRLLTKGATLVTDLEELLVLSALWVGATVFQGLLDPGEGNQLRPEQHQHAGCAGRTGIGWGEGRTAWRAPQIVDDKAKRMTNGKFKFSFLKK